MSYHFWNFVWENKIIATATATHKFPLDTFNK